MYLVIATDILVFGTVLYYFICFWWDRVCLMCDDNLNTVRLIPQAAMISLNMRRYVATLILAVAFWHKRRNRTSPTSLGFVDAPPRAFFLSMPHPFTPSVTPIFTPLHPAINRKFTDVPIVRMEKAGLYFPVFRMSHSAYYRLVGRRSLLSEGLIYEEFCSVGAAESQVY